MGTAGRGGIGVRNEMAVHAALKKLYCEPGDVLEGEVGPFVVDILKDARVVEVQRGGFASMRKKLGALLTEHVVHLVYPVAQEKYLVYISAETGEVEQRRRSPKRGTVWDVFSELVYIPKLITHPNFILEVVLIVEEEIRCCDGRGSWRRNGVSIVNRHLVDVVGRKVFSSPRHYLDVLPKSLPARFSNKDLSKTLNISTAAARRITYTLREAGIIQLAGKEGNLLLYSR